MRQAVPKVLCSRRRVLYSTRRVAVVNDFSVAATWLVGIRVDRIVVYTMIWCIHLDNAYTAVVSIATVVTDVAFGFTYVSAVITVTTIIYYSVT